RRAAEGAFILDITLAQRAGSTRLTNSQGREAYCSKQYTRFTSVHASFTSEVHRLSGCSASPTRPLPSPVHPPQSPPTYVPFCPVAVHTRSSASGGVCPFSSL